MDMDIRSFSSAASNLVETANSLIDTAKSLQGVKRNYDSLWGTETPANKNGTHMLPEYTTVKTRKTGGGSSRYRTTGVTGTSGRIRRVKGKKRKRKRKGRYRKKRSKKRYLPIVYKREDGGTLADPDCIYIGVANAPPKMINAMLCRCLVKELFKQINVFVDDFGKIINTQLTYTNLKIEVFYYDDERTSTLTSFTLVDSDTATNATFSAFVIVMAAQLELTFGVYQKRTLDTIKLTQVNGTVTSNIATIKGSGFQFFCQSYALLQVQNITLGTTTTGDTSEITNLQNNPLVGKAYQTNATGFIAKVKRGMAGTRSLIADDDTGLIFADGAALGPTYKKPPPTNFFDKKVYAKNIMISPGQIVNYKVSSYKSVNLAIWFRKYSQDIAEVNTNPEINLMGKSVMLGVEKMVDNRTETSAINVSFEYNQIQRAGYKYRVKSYTAPIIEVT